MTNGVSFSLVAGACCLLGLSYKLNSDDSTSTTKLTLNINSTGAKQLTNTGYESSIAQNTNLGTSIRELVIYDGTRYVLF